MCTYLHQIKAHWRESFIFPHFLFIFCRQSRRFLSFANCVLLVHSAVILQSGTRRHHHHRTFSQNLGFAVSAFIFLSEIRVCGSALICLIRDLWIGFYSFLAHTCDCLRLGFSLTKRSAQIFLNPKPWLNHLWRKSENIGHQRKSVPKIWFHGFFALCLNLLAYTWFAIAWIYGFFFSLSFMFLFHSVCWSHHSYLINQFRVNKLIWFPYSFLSFNKNFGLISIFACQLFDLRPSLIDIQNQWYC